MALEKVMSTTPDTITKTKKTLARSTRPLNSTRSPKYTRCTNKRNRKIVSKETIFLFLLFFTYIEIYSLPKLAKLFALQASSNASLALSSFSFLPPQAFKTGSSMARENE